MRNGGGGTSVPPFAFSGRARNVEGMARFLADASGRGKPSLRAELLANLAVLAVGALVLAVFSTALARLLGSGGAGIILLGVLMAADVVIFIVFGHYLVSRLVNRPLEALVRTTEAVANGELDRRAPACDTREFDQLARSVDRMTARVLDAQGALVRAEKLASVGRLAAGVAHEVGNPLAAIANYVELLRRRGTDPELISAIQREAGRIDVIVRSLLDYARPRDARREPLDLGIVAERAVELLRAQGVLHAVTLRTERAAAVPAMLGDAAALEQVFVNLLLNAVDAAGDGGTIVVAASGVRVGGADVGARLADPDAAAVGARTEARAPRHLQGAADGAPAVQVVVADSGPGVPVDLVDRVFDPFFTTKPPGRGTGLGLAIVARTVQDHGGRVDVARAREGGAAFTVTFPAIEA